MKRALSYSDSLKSSCSYWPGELHFSALSKEEVDIEIARNLSGDIHLIWSHLVLPIPRLLGKCPYCFRKTINIFSQHVAGNWGSVKKEEVFECECGWWGINFQWNTDGLNYFDQYRSNVIYGGVVKSFDLSSCFVPIDVLNNHIAKFPLDIYGTHFRKFEELVQYVFKSFYSCEVIHCGQSNDGGVDLILVNSDEPTLIQVKRRTKNSHTEGVGVVRDLLGAMFFNETRNGIVVSTANRFSRQSYSMIDNLLERRLLKTFELIDFTRFCEMLELTNSTRKLEPWRELITKQ